MALPSALLLVALAPSLAAQSGFERATVESIQPIEFHLLCGAREAVIDSRGRFFEPDRDYGWGSPPHRGYVGGITVGTKILSEGTTDPELTMHARLGFAAYRFDVPIPGSYVVTLHFNELLFQGREQNVFTITLEGQPVLIDLDLWARISARALWLPR